MKPGLGTYGYAWAIGVPGKEPPTPLDARGFIDRAVAHGVLCVELDDNLALHKFDEKSFSQLMKYAHRRGMEIIVGAREMSPSNLERYLEIAQKSSAPVLRFVVDGEAYKPSVKEIISVVRPLLPDLKSKKIQLAIENHDRLLSTEFEDIIQGVGSNNVGICLDSVNSMGAGEGIRTVVERLAPYTIHFHVKEFAVKRIWHKMGFAIEGLPLGQGQLPLEWIIDKIKGRCNRAVYESWVPEQGTIDDTMALEAAWAKESINYLKKMLRA